MMSCLEVEEEKEESNYLLHCCPFNGYQLRAALPRSSMLCPSTKPEAYSIRFLEAKLLFLLVAAAAVVVAAATAANTADVKAASLVA